MIRQLSGAALAAATALAIAACGGGSEQASSSGGGGSPSSAGAKSATISVEDVGDVGRALVDADGKLLYTPDVEAGGRIHCTDACESFWKPLTAAGAKPTANGDAGKLGVIKRPDGSTQVTANGAPLYTFAEDGKGDAKGDGFIDDFDGQHFVWHAVMAGGKTSESQGSAGSSSNGDSNGGGYSKGGY